MRAGAVVAAARVTGLLVARFGVALRGVVRADVVVGVLDSVAAAGALSALGVGWALTAGSGAVVVGGASCAKAVAEESARVAAIAMVALVLL